MNILPPKSLGDKGIQSVLQDLSKRKKITKQPLPAPNEVLDRIAGYLADKGVLRKKSELVQEKQSRCWEGYEPVPGKKPYTNGSCRPKGEKKDAEKKAETNIPLSPEESYMATQLIGKSLFSAIQLAKEQELRKSLLEQKGGPMGDGNILRIPIPQHLLPSQKQASLQPEPNASADPGMFARALKLNSHPVKKLMGMQSGFRDAKKEFFMQEKAQIEKELMEAQKEYISLLERIKMGEETGEITKTASTPCVDAFCDGIAYAALFVKEAEELPDLSPEIKNLFDKVAASMKTANSANVDISDGSVRRVLGDIAHSVKKPFQPAIDTGVGALLTTAAGSAYLTYLLRKKMREEPDKYMQESLPTKVELQPYS